MNDRNQRWLWLVGLTGLSVLKTGYCVFCDNHATQLPLVYKLQKPELFPGDPFLEALSGYMGWVWWLVARVSEVIDLELLMGVLFLLTRALLIYAAARLARVLVPDSKIAPLAAALLMALGPYPILGDGTLVEMYWEQSSMFMPLFVLSLVLLLEHRPVRFFLLFGIAYLVNPLYGSWACLFLGATWLADPERGPWRRYLVPLPLFVLLVAPIFIGGVGVLSQENVDMEQWMWVNRLLISPHAFPDTWPWRLFVRFAFFSVLVLVAGRVYPGQSRRLLRLTVTWTALSWAALALAFPAAWGISRALLVFQPARATEFLYLAGGTAVASVVVWRAERAARAARFALVAVSFSALGYLLIPEFREYALLPSILLAAILALGLLWMNRKRRLSDRDWLTVSLVWLLLATGLTCSAAFARRVKHQGGVARALYRRPMPEMLELAAWAKENSSQDAVFFHDPMRWKWSQFRYLAERPVFVTWKDGSAVLWSADYATEWADRFAAFGFRGELRDRWDLRQSEEAGRIRRALIAHYEGLGDEDLRRMRRQYRIDFWVAPAATASEFPEVARAGGFKILDVRSGARSR